MEKEEEGSEKEKHWKDENDDKKKKTYGYSNVAFYTQPGDHTTSVVGVNVTKGSDFVWGFVGLH